MQSIRLESLNPVFFEGEGRGGVKKKLLSKITTITFYIPQNKI